MIGNPFSKGENDKPSQVAAREAKEAKEGNPFTRAVSAPARATEPAAPPVVAAPPPAAAPAPNPFALAAPVIPEEAPEPIVVVAPRAVTPPPPAPVVVVPAPVPSREPSGPTSLERHLQAESSTTAPVIPKIDFNFEAVAPKPVAEAYDPTMPDRAGGYGALHEEKQFGVNVVNPFLEKKLKKDVVYNPFAASPTARTGTVVVGTIPAATTPPVGSTTSAVRKPVGGAKTRAPPTREGNLDKLSGGKHWYCFSRSAYFFLVYIF